MRYEFCCKIKKKQKRTSRFAIFFFVNWKILIIFLVVHKILCCEYLSEAPDCGTSNEYQNICFHREIRKILLCYPFYPELWFTKWMSENSEHFIPYTIFFFFWLRYLYAFGSETIWWNAVWSGSAFCEYVILSERFVYDMLVHFTELKFVHILSPKTDNCPSWISRRDRFCVEVLQPNQPNGVMSSAVSLPNHMFTGQA